MLKQTTSEKTEIISKNVALEEQVSKTVNSNSFYRFLGVVMPDKIQKFQNLKIIIKCKMIPKEFSKLMCQFLIFDFLFSQDEKNDCLFQIDDKNELSVHYDTLQKKHDDMVNKYELLEAEKFKLKSELEQLYLKEKSKMDTLDRANLRNLIEVNKDLTYEIR